MFLLSALALLTLATVPPTDMTLWYTRPASNWSEASVVSNGRLTAAVFGEVAEDCIRINDDTAGRPVADLLLTFNHTGQVSDYARSLDRKHAVATVAYKAENTAFKREVFSTAADNVIVVRLVAAHRGALNFQAALSSPHMHSVKCPRANHLIVHGETDSPSQPFEGWLVVKPEGGTVESGGGSVSVKRADAATLIIAARIGEHPDYVCRKTVGPAVRKEYPQLIGDHLRGSASIKPD